MTKYKYTERIYLGRDENGKIKRKVINANTKVELAILEEQAINEFKKSQGEIQTLSSYAHKWFDDTKQAAELNTREMYKYLLMHIDNSPAGAKNIKDVKLEDLQDIINLHKDTPNTCKKLRMCLNSVMNYAVLNDKTRHNPCKDIVTPKEKRPERYAFTRDEINALRRAVLSEKDMAYVFTLYYFGVRPGEALGLKPSDFNWERRELTVSRAVAYKENVIPYIKTTKTDNIRRLPIPDGASEIIRPYAEEQNEWLFSMPNGTLITKSSNAKRWARIVRQWNKELLNPFEKCKQYNMRYTYATKLYYSGISLKKASELMGHNDTTMILQIYAQLDNERENIQGLITNFD